jgi:hypothetical protein
VSGLETLEARRTEWRWVIGGLVAAGFLLIGQFAGGVIREAVSPQPSYLDKLKTCLTERSTAYAPATSDPIASSAHRGALRTSVSGNGVTVSLGGSEDDAERIYDDYESVAAPGPRLERQRKVVLLWDQAPTADQHAFMVLCTLDAQE